MREGQISEWSLVMVAVGIKMLVLGERSGFEKAEQQNGEV